MNKQIKTLVAKSYKNNQLDPKVVEVIADHLNRQTLKQYIRLLKHEENKKQIIVTSSRALTNDDKKNLQNQFPGKKIIYILDPEMISGIRIVDRDTEFETSINQTFNDIIRFLNE